VTDETPDPKAARSAYVGEVLKAYVATPGVLGRVRRADRELAGRLYDQRVPLYAIRNAFLVAAARRLRNNAFATPLPPIRSLHYFLPVLRELQDRPPGPRDIDQARRILGLGEPPL
jgi:hypothetical protein